MRFFAPVRYKNSYLRPFLLVKATKKLSGFTVILKKYILSQTAI